MADRMGAEIWIGGKLSRSLLEEFPVSDLRLDWEENPLESTSEQDILNARVNGLLHFADFEASWGEFGELEGWLREHDIPFERYSSGKYEYDPCCTEFRPDLPGKPNRDTPTNQEGAAVICLGEIEKAVRGMARLLKDKRTMNKRLQAWERAYRKLARSIPPELPPLPPFEIVD